MDEPETPAERGKNGAPATPVTKTREAASTRRLPASPRGQVTGNERGRTVPCRAGHSARNVATSTPSVI
jgi:hypothetical protein